MDKKSKEALRRYKKSRQAQSSSESSSSSDSDSGSSSSYSSSESERRRRHKKSRQSGTVRRSTSSSDERRKREKRDHCKKKLEAKRNHLKRKLKEAKLKKKAAAAAAALSGHSHRALSPATQAKLKKLAERGHLRAASKERREREKEKHRAALREREREHRRPGSRSPTKITKIRIHQDVKRQKSPPRVHHQLMSREKIIIQTRTRDRTPSAERERQRHEHKLRHEDIARDRERREREAARDKERAEALARCQERQRERERLAREKLRREDEEKYGKAIGSSDRLIPRGTDRDVAPVRVYSSRERSMECSKREMDPYDHAYIRKHRAEPDFEDEKERRSHLEREDILRQREYMARRRELSPGEYVTVSGTRLRGDPRDLYNDDERERVYKRPYLDESATRAHPTNREHWLAERDLRDREIHDHSRDYREVEGERIYPDERQRLPARDGRERPPFGARLAPEWKRDWSSGRERTEWQGEEGGQSTSARGMGFIGGPKRGGAVGIIAKLPQLIQQRERPPSEPDWDTEEGQIDTPKKSEGTPKRDWIEHDQRDIPLSREKLVTANRPWNVNEWREGEEGSGPSGGYQRGPTGLMIHHPRSDRGGRGGYRGRGGHIDHGERMPGHGFRPHHPPSLMNLAVSPMGVYHGAGLMTRFPNKRNMTYTNPNLLKKQQAALAAAKAAAQASAVVAATTAVAAAKAAAQSVANAITNPGILAQISSNRPQVSDEKPEAGEIVGDCDQNEESLPAVTVILSSEQKNKKNSGELSEISDSDDDILTKTEKKAKIENEDSNSQAKQINENKEEDEEELMDFEEISDGELEEERAARGVGDALGVDWSSLVAETKRVTSNQATTAKQKWQPHRIILDVGISMRMASEEYAKRLLNNAKQQLDEELKAESIKQETKVDIKCEIKDEPSSLSNLDDDSQATAFENEDSTCDTKPKEEVDDKNDIKPVTEEIATETLNVDILPPLACMQVSQQKLQMERRQLIANACGANSRALSARQDLKLRRQLCGLPARECEITRNLPQTSDKLKAMALAAFQRTLQVK